MLEGSIAVLCQCRCRKGAGIEPWLDDAPRNRKCVRSSPCDVMKGSDTSLTREVPAPPIDRRHESSAWVLAGGCNHRATSFCLFVFCGGLIIVDSWVCFSHPTFYCISLQSWPALKLLTEALEVMIQPNFTKKTNSLLAPGRRGINLTVSGLVSSCARLPNTPLNLRSVGAGGVFQEDADGAGKRQLFPVVEDKAGGN